MVRDENGEPLPGQMVMSGSGPDMFGNMSTTNADGEFEFKNVPAGNQTLMVMKVQSGGGFGFGANTKSVLVKEGEEVAVRVVSVDPAAKRIALSRLDQRGAVIGSTDSVETEEIDRVLDSGAGRQLGTNLGNLFKKALDDNKK